MKEWVAVLRAADAATRWHVHQRRKGSAQEPYINHLLEVASLVAEATHGKDPDLVAAALLHDAIEDQEVPYELIARLRPRSNTEPRCGRADQSRPETAGQSRLRDSNPIRSA